MNKGISVVLVRNHTAEEGLQQGEIKTERAAVSTEVKLKRHAVNYEDEPAIKDWLKSSIFTLVSAREHL